MVKDNSIINWELYMKLKDVKRIIKEEKEALNPPKITKERLREIVREEVVKLLKETA